MDSQMLGVIGGTAGALIGVAGAVYGCAASCRRAVNDAQRRFYRKLFVILVFAGIAFTGGVWLTSTGHAPRWIYFGMMTAMACSIGPGVVILNRRLAALAKDSHDETRE